MINNKQIIIVSTCQEDWGGSEELWGRSIPYFLDFGYEIIVCKEKINAEHPEFVKLLEAGVTLHQLNPDQIDPITKNAETEFALFLHQQQPSIVIISQGINFDGLGMGYLCLEQKIPYVLLAQKAVNVFWPNHIDREDMKNVYINAEKSFFVSDHNLQLTEEQFGTRLTNAIVISNPVKVQRVPLQYPSTDNGYKLACIGRFLLIDKGQDILIRIMAKDKWKSRPLKVSFIGSGVDKVALIELARLLNVKNVEFLDNQDDIKEVWKSYHGLILPSRSEGTPLVLLEAMALGRVSIVSDAGGNADLIDESKSGFIGQPNEKDFEDAMEKAWEARDTWQEMGIMACEKIKNKIPLLPERDFAETICKLDTKSQLISVIIPTYNRAHIVEHAIISVLNQSHPYVQLIVADDGSIDDTDSLMTKYPQVTYLKLPHGGQAHARNEGLKHAKGVYMATLDSDDTWEPAFLETCLKIMEEHKLDFVFTNWMQDLTNGEFIDRFSICKVLEQTLNETSDNTIILDDLQLRKIYLGGCPSPSSSLLFRMSSLRSNWSSGLRIADDWCLLMDMIFTKPCKAGFTRDILWRKKVDGLNIYDGRDRYDLIRDLWTHDLEYLFCRFKVNFTNEEKKEMRQNLSYNYFQYSYFQLRHKKKLWLGVKYGAHSILANNRIIFQMFLRLKSKLERKINDSFLEKIRQLNVMLYGHLK